MDVLDAEISQPSRQVSWAHNLPPSLRGILEASYDVQSQFLDYGVSGFPIFSGSLSRILGCDRSCGVAIMHRTDGILFLGNSSVFSLDDWRWLI